MLLPSHGPAGNAASYGTHKAMMTGKVAGNAADESSPEAASGIGRHRRRRYGKSQRATKQQRFHVHRSTICCRNARPACSVWRQEQEATKQDAANRYDTRLILMRYAGSPCAADSAQLLQIGSDVSH